MSDGYRTGAVDRRKVLSGIGVGVAGLAGCLGSDDGSDDEADSISITGVWTENEQESFEAVIGHVEDEANVDVTYHPRNTDGILTNTLMDYESGVATADIVVMPSPARIRSDAENGHLAAVGDVWDPEAYAADPGPVSVDGNVYAAPFKMDLKPGFWYRKSFFDEHGLSEPETYDEFLTLLDEIAGIDGVDAPLAAGGGKGWPLSDFTEAYLLRQENGAQLQQDLIDGEADFTDERVKTAFEEIQHLVQNGYFSVLREFGVQYEYFWENSLPLYFMGSWTPGFEAIEDPSDLGVFRLPGTTGMVASVNWFTVPAYVDDAETARDVLGELVSPGAQQVWAERGGFIASSTDVPEDAYEVDVMSDLVDLAAEVTLVSDLDDAVGNPFQEEFWSQLKGFWQEPDAEIDTVVSTLDDALTDAHEG